jgi:hypothetical protein
MRMLPLVAACAAALAWLPAGAQTLKPGLWEVQSKVNNAQMGEAMAEMQKQMKDMPPEQRRQMEAMMAQHGMQGMHGAPGAGAPMAMQMCMTREMVERNEMPMQDGCRMTQQTRSGNTMKMAFTCTNPPSSGEGQVTFSSPEAYSSRMTVQVKGHGKAETTTVEGSGKWLKADCGNVKPMMPRGK